MESKSQADEMALWGMGLFGLFLLQRLWAVKIRPWAEDFVPALKNGGEVALGPVQMGTADLVVLAVLATSVAVVVLTVRSSVRARRRRRAESSS